MTEPLSIFDEYAATGGASLHARGRLATAALLAEMPARLGGPVLEIGCGTGETAVQLCERSASVVATDLSIPMTRAARARARWCGIGDRLTILPGSGDGLLPFTDQCFGVVVVESVLAIQSEDVLGTMVGEIRRVVRDSGRVLVNETVWLSRTTRHTAAEINRGTAAALGLIQATTDPFDVIEWAEMFGAAGLDPIRIIRVDDLVGTRFGRPGLNGVSARSRVYTVWRRLVSISPSRGFGGRRGVKNAISALAPIKPCLEGRIFVLAPRAAGQ